MAQPRRIILGLVGNPGSGKTTLGRYLAKRHKFYHFEGSDGLRTRAQEQNVLLFTREDYSNFHRKLQKELGQDVLARTLLARPEQRLVFVGLRTVTNARALQAAGGLIVALDCPVEQRFGRIDHSSLKYEKSLQDFQDAETEEYTSPDGYGADVLSVMQLADATLDTSLAFEGTTAAIDDLIAQLADKPA